MSLNIIGGPINQRIEYFEVIKAPPSILPIVDYINDTANPINNLYKKFFQFRYRFVYDDNEKSVWSAISKMPIPENSIDDGSNTQGGFQNAITITVNTGDINVVKIEIAGRVNIESEWSDFFLIDTLDKKRDNIFDNLSYNYIFKNDSVYVPVDIQESNLLFDYVPDEANALELANGNTLVVGGLKDGYDRDTKLNVVLSSVNLNSPATPSTLTAVLSGPNGTGTFPDYQEFNRFFSFDSFESLNAFAGTIIFTGVPQVGDEIIIDLQGYSTRLKFSDLTGAPNGSEDMYFNDMVMRVVVQDGWGIPEIVRAFQEHPLRFGYGFGRDIDSGAGTRSARPRQPFFPIPADAPSNLPLYPLPFPIDQNILYVGAFVPRTPPTTGNFDFDPRRWRINRPTVTVRRGFSFNNADSFPILKWNGVYRYGIAYYNRNGKTNGVYTNNQMVLRTGSYDTSNDWTPIGSVSILPESETAEMYIGHEPPPWADYYHIVRTKDLSCDFSLMVISPDINFNNPLNGYWYIDIHSITETNNDISESKNVINYSSTSFVDGDRVRILQKLNTDGSVNWTTDKHIDLPIIAVETHSGRQYIKVKSITIPSGFINVQENNRLVIEIYRPAKVLSDEDLIYYEIGERYDISTDSSGRRYHEGQRNLFGAPLSTYTETVECKFDSTLKNVTIFPATTSAISWASTINPGDTLLISSTASNNNSFIVASIGIASVSISISFSSPAVVTESSVGGTTFNLIGNTNVNYAYINLDKDGDYYYRARVMVNSTDNATQGVLYVADRNFSDNYLSAVWSQGRPLIVDEDIKEEYYPSMLRFSQSYIYGTNINNLSRFYPNNFEEADASFGDILRLKTRENFIRLFQRFKTGMIPIYRQIIIDNAQSSQIALSERLLNKPNYYSGEYGIDKYGSSLVSTDYGDYFIDTNNKAIVRVSLDGLTNISDTNNLASWANNNIKEDSFGFGCFNYENRNVIMYIAHIEPVPNVNFYNIISNIVAYSESDKNFESFYGFTDASNMLFVNGFIFTGYQGNLYIHDNQVRNNFFGVQQSSAVSTVFNGALQAKKTYTAIEELSNGLWTGTIATGPLTNQSTSLSNDDFQKTVGAFVINSKENKFNATIKRDENSVGGKYLGIPMKGLYAQVALTNSLTTEQRLISVSLKYIQSPLTNS
jgi:hypothetical protein